VYPIVDTDAVNPILNEILKAELSGVVRYTHYALVITGPNRLPLVEFMKAQAGLCTGKDCRRSDGFRTVERELRRACTVAELSRETQVGNVVMK